VSSETNVVLYLRCRFYGST